MNKFLLYFNEKYQGDFDKIFNALATKEPIKKNDLDLSNVINYDYTLMTSSEYFHQLKFSKEPPFIIFTKGNKKILHKDEKAISIMTSNEIRKDAFDYVDDFVKTCKTQELIPYITPNTEFSKFLIETLCANNIPIVLTLDCGIDDYVKNNLNIVEMIIKNNGVILSHALSMPTRDLSSRKSQIEEFKSSMSKGLIVFPFEKNEKLDFVKNATRYASNLVDIVSLSSNQNDTQDLSEFKEVIISNNMKDICKKLNLDYNDTNLEYYVKDANLIVKKYLEKIRQNKEKLKKSKQNIQNINLDIDLEF